MDSRAYTSSPNFDSLCPDLVKMAERELSAFLKVVTKVFGSKEARASAEDWLRELIEIEGLPTSVREWRLITTKVLARLASRLTTSSLSSLSTEPQVA